MRRVVVTGLGVVAPNAIGIPDFTRALREGRSGIRFHQKLQDFKLTCHVAGFPKIDEATVASRFTEEQRRNLNSVMTFGGLAAIECWLDAGLTLEPEHTDWESGTVFGTGLGAADTIGDRLVPMTRDGQCRRMVARSRNRLCAAA